MTGNSNETAYASSEEGGDDVKSARPLCPGRHTCYNGWDNVMQSREGERTIKPSLSSDRRLQLACVKSESLVTADQHAAVNTFQGDTHATMAGTIGRKTARWSPATSATPVAS